MIPAGGILSEGFLKKVLWNGSICSWWDLGFSLDQNLGTILFEMLTGYGMLRAHWIRISRTSSSSSATENCDHAVCRKFIISHNSLILKTLCIVRVMRILRKLTQSDFTILLLQPPLELRTISEEDVNAHSCDKGVKVSSELDLVRWSVEGTCFSILI